MNETRAGIDRLAPIVVDHELAAMCCAKSNCVLDLSAKNFGSFILDAELHELDAGGHKPGKPLGVGNDGIEGIETEHVAPEPSRGQEAWSILKHGVPATGVEGEAMSRASINPASKASRPASIAFANASAIWAGSPALATAVFNSTASYPISMASAAWEGAPTPASMTSGI